MKERRPSGEPVLAEVGPPVILSLGVAGYFSVVRTLRSVARSTGASVLALWVALPALGQADPAELLVQAAVRQVGVTVSYDGGYRRLAYPGGDPPLETGVCTDVIIRAYRDLGVDLQVKVHQDMKAAFSAYPKTWGLSRPDPNIDHRRVPNLQAFLKRAGAALPVSARPADYVAGSVVTWMLPGNLPHIGIVSGQRSANGTPLIVHNIGRGASVEDILFQYPITGHFRYIPVGAPRRTTMQ